MQQNIYDNPVFFEGYRQLREREHNTNMVLEIPVIRSLMPPLNELRVMDLGCGFGDFCRYARSGGAASVVGVDISRRMLETAREQTDDNEIAYIQSALENLVCEDESLDLIVSSLVFQYLDNKGYEDIVGQSFRWLKPGGWFIFSVEHPYCTALNQGWHKDESGRKLHWKVDNYRDEGQRSTFWFVDGRIIYHRMIETYVNTLINAGFMIKHFLESDIDPQYSYLRDEYTDEYRRPPFLFISCQKPSNR